MQTSPAKGDLGFEPRQREVVNTSHYFSAFSLEHEQARRPAAPDTCVLESICPPLKAEQAASGETYIQ